MTAAPHDAPDVGIAASEAAAGRDSAGIAIDFACFLGFRRPRPRELFSVADQVRASRGDRPDDWSRCRTHTVLIALNVAELIEDELHHPGLMGLGEALENFDRHFPAASDTDVDAWDAGVDSIAARYTGEYQLYAERFTRAAEHLAEQILGRPGEVCVDADANPNSHWWTGATINNPHQSDQLELQLWHAAHDATPLPDVDIWLGLSKA